MKNTVLAILLLLTPANASIHGADQDNRQTAVAYGNGNNNCGSSPSTVTPFGNTLAAQLCAYPGYTGSLNPSGEMMVRFNADGSFLLSLNVSGVEGNCVGCGVHIHTGTTCDDAAMVGGHYWDIIKFGDGAANDPWNKWGFYKSDATGKSTTFIAGDSGVNYVKNIGRTAVLHASNGTRIACGVLKASDPRKANKALKAPLGAYPGYTGPLKPAGMATVYFLDGGAFRFYINLRGVEQNCLECGVHIHTGTTCSDAALVGGHYWNKAILGANTTDDPWTADYGAFYTSNYYGKATRYFYLDQGYGYEDTVGHAVVIHAKDGTRISCGVLNPKWW